VTFDDTLHKFEMLGVGCVRGGMEHQCITKKDKRTGILRSENIVKLGFEWRSRMVVLSACNTAKGCVSNNVFKSPCNIPSYKCSLGFRV
jgi:hypothetical protein